MMENRGFDSEEMDLRGAIEMGAGGKDKGGKPTKGGKTANFYGHDDVMGLGKSGRNNIDDQYATNNSRSNKVNKIHPDDRTPNLGAAKKGKNSEKVNWDFVEDGEKGGDYDPFKKIEKGEYDEFTEWKRDKAKAKSQMLEGDDQPVSVPKIKKKKSQW